MGGGDLNLKKSWHPATFRNQERVWKREHEAEEEKKKLEQLLKDREVERQLQELQRLSGVKKSTERLEWMYAAGPASSTELISEDQEAYLLGRRSVNKLLDSRGENEISDNSRLCSEGFTSYGLTANSQKDIKAKILEDPLYAMKKKEQDMIQSLLDNKYKLKQIKREIDGKDTLQKYAKQSSKRSRRHHLREKSSPLECHGSRRHGYKTASKRHYRRERSRKC